MEGGATVSPGVAWLGYALLTVLAWGVYGILLHTGQTSMADSVNGRYKAFLFVGIAYFLTAVLAPLVVLKPVDGGSSIDITIAHDQAARDAALEAIATHLLDLPEPATL